MHDFTIDEAWHTLPVSAVAEDLGTDLDSGLTGEEGRRRLTVVGPNQLAESRRWTRLRRLGNQFKDVLVWLLIAAAISSALLLDAWVDAAAIASIVILNAIIGYAQESRANTALDRLRQMEAPTATVLRDRVVSELPARDVVPGDVLLVEPGDRIGADARVSLAVRLVVDEAPLTGESLPVAKSEDPSPEDSVLAERTSMLYAGTTVVSGRGRALVIATGMRTEMGRIADLFGDEQRSTPLEADLARIGRRLAGAAAIAALLIFGAGVARSFPVETMALTAVALAVAAIPEGLPAVITVSLAGGLQRMAKRNAVVRRLPAVETLGAVNVICTDKTGTLTAPELQVTEWWWGNGTQTTGLDGSAPDWLATTAALCNDALRSPGGWSGDPTETALLDALDSDSSPIEETRSRFPRIDEAGFDGRRKRMSTLHPSGTEFVLLVKGAPEVIVSRCASIAVDHADRPLPDEERGALLRHAEGMAQRGMRTLALAMRPLTARPDDPGEEEHDLRLLGFVGLQERVRPEVARAVATAKSAGIRTVMVTGDHATTAAAIADEVGIGSDGLMDGGELSLITAEQLAETIPEHHVFARVDPGDKVKIIEAWQSTGAKVAMTGDGVNDAPALHRADIGVAMGSGTDVARESAAMVLTDDNYATIVAAVAEGRRLFNNLRNVVHYLLSANASEVFFVLVGFLAFGFMGEPLLAVQLLWINLISDALPAIALGMEPAAPGSMRERPGAGRDVLSGRNTVLLLTQGLILAAAAVAAMLFGAYGLELTHPEVQTIVFSTLVFSQLLHALSTRARPVGPDHGSPGLPGSLLVVGVAGSAVLQMGVVYTDIGNTLFHTEPLGMSAIATAVIASIASMIVVRLLDRVLARTRS